MVNGARWAKNFDDSDNVKSIYGRKVLQMEPQ
nr:MAG TPA: hypothetical protein [Caudoviricetes sp.]